MEAILFNMQTTYLQKNPEKHIVEQEKDKKFSDVLEALHTMKDKHESEAVELQNIIIAPVQKSPK